MPADLFHRYPPALRIQCPVCGAQPATPCRSRRGRRTTHTEREHVAEHGRTPTRTQRGAR